MTVPDVFSRGRFVASRENVFAIEILSVPYTARNDMPRLFCCSRLYFIRFSRTISLNEPSATGKRNTCFLSVP